MAGTQRRPTVDGREVDAFCWLSLSFTCTGQLRRRSRLGSPRTACRSGCRFEEVDVAVGDVVLAKRGAVAGDPTDAVSCREVGDNVVIQGQPSSQLHSATMPHCLRSWSKARMATGRHPHAPAAPCAALRIAMWSSLIGRLASLHDTRFHDPVIV